MSKLTRRSVCLGISAISTLSLAERFAHAETPTQGAGTTADQWIDEVMIVKASDSPLKLQRFREPIYVLLEPITWKPSTIGQSKTATVTVPSGFVSDLASIPRVFWSLIPRDAEYAYPAIVHDFLYWDQSRPKSEADEIFRWSMQDLDVSKPTVATIFEGVSVFGKVAWQSNASLKLQGEKRILKKYPPNARTNWSDWKLMPDVFL